MFSLQDPKVIVVIVAVVSIFLFYQQTLLHRQIASIRSFLCGDKGGKADIAHKAKAGTSSGAPIPTPRSSRTPEDAPCGAAVNPASPQPARSCPFDDGDEFEDDSDIQSRICSK